MVPAHPENPSPLTLEAAAPTYQLLCPGEAVIGPKPQQGGLASERLGWFARQGRHSVTAQDWHTWLAYSDRWL